MSTAKGKPSPKPVAAAVPAKKATAKKPVALNTKDPCYDAASLIVHTNFLKQLLTFMGNFNTDINLSCNRNGISIGYLDSSHVAYVDITLFGTGMYQWSWKLQSADQREFQTGFNIKSLLRLMAHGAKQHKYVHLFFSPNRNVISVHFLRHNKHTGEPIIAAKPSEAYDVHKLDIKEDSLTIPDVTPDIAVRLRTDDFGTIISDWKTFSDEIAFEFEYVQTRAPPPPATPTKSKVPPPKKTLKRETDDDDPPPPDDDDPPPPEEDMKEKRKKIKTEVHGKDAKKVAYLNGEVKDEQPEPDNVDNGIILRTKTLLFSFNDKEKNGTGCARFSLFNEGDAGAEEETSEDAPWDRFNIVSTDRVEEDERKIETHVEENLHHVVLSKAKAIAAEMNGGETVAKKRKKGADEAEDTENNCGTIVINSIRNKPFDRTVFSVKLLTFAAVGKPLDSRVTLELYSDGRPMAIRYDLAQGLGVVKCWLAPKIEEEKL